MYMVAFMYPNADGIEFNYQHFVNVHLPLGVGLTKKHLDLKPRKIVIYTPTAGAGDSKPAYCAVSSVFFDSEAEAKQFVSLFQVEEAARRLTEDFLNYTPAPPEILLAQVMELNDMDGLIGEFANMEQSSGKHSG